MVACSYKSLRLLQLFRNLSLSFARGMQAGWACTDGWRSPPDHHMHFTSGNFRHGPAHVLAVNINERYRRIVVEDVQLSPAFTEEHKPPQGAVARRMVFLSNQGLVQSEALMAPPPTRHVRLSFAMSIWLCQD